jgi:hypothetical protein
LGGKTELKMRRKYLNITKGRVYENIKHLKTASTYFII